VTVVVTGLGRGSPREWSVEMGDRVCGDLCNHEDWGTGGQGGVSVTTSVVGSGERDGEVWSGVGDDRVWLQCLLSLFITFKSSEMAR
jgi:hypothetical protein